MTVQTVSRSFGAAWIAGIMALAPAAAQTAAPATTAPAAPVTKEFEPSVGQQGKDVIWVPTADAHVSRMLDMAKVTPADYVIDLGSGDGRTVIAAAKRGAKAHGIEYEQAMVDLSIRNAAQAGVSDMATFVQGDLFASDFSNATVLTMFLLPDINLRLRPTILDMKPGTRVVSNTFTMGDWEADQTAEATTDCTSYCKAYFWVVPAKVDGAWRSESGDIALQQTYKMLSGTVTSGNVVSPIQNGKLTGDQITFTAGDQTFSGRVNGQFIEGTRESGASKTPWRATRAS